MGGGDVTPLENKYWLAERHARSIHAATKESAATYGRALVSFVLALSRIWLEKS
jgi:hypothetical protein